MRRRTSLGAVLPPALLGAAMLLLSAWLGSDASWDLRNYHLYDAFAALHKPGFLDLVPAQRQTFHPPMLDLPPLWLRFRLNHWPHLLDALLALPSAIAVMLAWCIGRLVQPADMPYARVSLLLAILFGATGAAGLPTTGTSMSEMPAACFALAGLGLMLVGRAGTPWTRQALLDVAAGIGFGAAFALKPTLGSLALAGMLAMLLCSTGPLPRRLGSIAGVAAGIGLGALLIGGPWWWHLTRLTGSPLFPYENQLFQSPLYPPVALTDDRFLPHSELQALFYPFFWSLSRSQLSSELLVRDPRLAVAFIAMICCGLIAFLRSARPIRERRAGLLLVFLTIGFVLWEVQFGVLRYLAPIELLSGLVVLESLQPLRHGRQFWAPMLPPAIMGVLLLGAASITIYPDWGRASSSGTAASVQLPPLPPEAMVLLLTPDPMAYVAAFAPRTLRFVGVDNNLVHPGQDSALEHRIEQAVRQHPGPLFGLEVPAAKDPAESVLGFYGLHRAGPCQPVRTTLEQDGLRICRLAR